MRIITVILLLIITLFCYAQVENNSIKEQKNSSLIFGIDTGAGWAYEDKAHLFNTSICLTIDNHIKNTYFIQFAPQYSWLWKWNEHYLTLPIHLRKKVGEKFSLFAGPALTFDVGYFRDLGISGGAYFHFNKKSALVLSAFTFTLYDYYIDYLYVPISISYHYNLF